MQKILRKNAFIAPTKLCIVSFLMAQFQDLTIESGMKNLKSLTIGSRDIDANGAAAEALRKALPDCDVSLRELLII